ncbi:hypothetical protein VNO77_05790 [Canavalia gladiata]|uniref:Uncharacterized protein n=1 Tax=Canavalia gladiata TaxID=3824 RepID=A0AAN9MYZ6_CANGL
MTSMDVSPLLLIEDSADSEDDSGFFTLCPSSIIGENEDDAESCNCDTASTCGIPKDGEGHEDDQGFEESYDDEDGGNSNMWMSVAAFEDEAETRIGEVNVNGSEDRLFWETCMAVGYP